MQPLPRHPRDPRLGPWELYTWARNHVAEAEKEKEKEEKEKEKKEKEKEKEKKEKEKEEREEGREEEREGSASGVAVPYAFGVIESCRERWNWAMSVLEGGGLWSARPGEATLAWRIMRTAEKVGYPAAISRMREKETSKRMGPWDAYVRALERVRNGVGATSSTGRPKEDWEMDLEVYQNACLTLEECDAKWDWATSVVDMDMAMATKTDTDRRDKRDEEYLDDLEIARLIVRAAQQVGYVRERRDGIRTTSRPGRGDPAP